MGAGGVGWGEVNGRIRVTRDGEGGEGECQFIFPPKYKSSETRLYHGAAAAVPFCSISSDMHSGFQLKGVFEEEASSF